MLQLQRASAGSGKTFTLAKKFIWFFITIKDASGKFRLRKPHELEDSLNHILAITFTNKATNEMKERIVEKLADLSSNKSVDNIDYLGDFVEELGVSEDKIRSVCRSALSILLNDYNDFKVTTIDSFFQTVLRTFAYETDLNDSYEVELNSDFIAQSGLDATLAEINTDSGTSETVYWIETLMKEQFARGGKWNIFDRSKSRSSIYKEIMESVVKLQKEDFKRIEIQIDDYFKRNPDFRKIYEEAKSYFEKDLSIAFRSMVNAANKCLSTFNSVGIDPEKDGVRWLSGHITKCKYAKWLTLPNFSEIKIKDGSGALRKEANVSKDVSELLTSAVQEMYSCRRKFEELLSSPYVKHWQLYQKNLMFLGLIQSIRRNSADFMRRNNIVELSNTNILLERVIGDDDAPFIYERIGSELNHFLIDEFQDTSALQWGNLRPLLMESEGRGNDNLIIGDAKQSIYRFRNADANLILKTVPAQFPYHEERGFSVKDNTNWRSLRNIVLFNNSFFYALSRKVDALSYEENSTRYANLYSNTVQHTNKEDELGYVEISLPLNTKLDNLDSDDSDDSDTVPPAYFDELPKLVNNLCSRGYSLKDIAFLVRTKKQGKMVINALMRYNEEVRTSDAPYIEFISEESLLISQSEAVKTIISVLEIIVNASNIEIRSGEEKDVKGTISVSQMACNFNFFSMKNPNLKGADLIREFFKNANSWDGLSEMLSGMQTVVLPSLVEAIVDTFISQDIRRSNAPFIAAFQDLTLDYCQRYGSDIYSFLAWWKEKGSEISISSPDGMDAVQVMTIHKSKGLEFKCVILPIEDTTFSVNDRQSEWRWVEPYLPDDLPVELPPYVPIETVKALRETQHADIYDEYYNAVLMDKINTEYVAFTRAVNELYIFAPVGFDSRKNGPKVKPGSLAELILQILPEINESQPGSASSEQLNDLLPIGCVKSEDNKFIIGSPINLVDLQKSKNDKNGKKEKRIEKTLMEDYKVNPNTEALKYKESTSSVIDQDEDADPRSEGNLMHAVMSELITEADLTRALLSIKVNGLATVAMLTSVSQLIEKALSEVRDYGWFDGRYKVINERPILRCRAGSKRPDRIMISSDGDVVVVDYKFGEHRNDKLYSEQVAEYIELLKSTGRFRSFAGYVWYVKQSQIVKVI